MSGERSTRCYVTALGAEEYPVFESFDDYDLNENLLRGIYSYGFEKPNAIQERGIKPILDGRDTIVEAQSGTGKTATFVIGCLERIDYGIKGCQGLILAPTRELANQIRNVALALGDYNNVKCHACSCGGVRDDIDKLREGQHLVVGTPGRVYDMIGRRHLRVDDVITFVIDEADEMLSRGFKDQIYDIFKTMPPNTQVCLFSATLTPDILDLTTKFMCDAVQIVVKKLELTGGCSFEADRVCPICSKHQWVLIVNEACGHGACENCWTHMAESQVPCCTDRRQLGAHCLIQDCGRPISTGIRQHLCKLSESVRSLDTEFHSALRRLRNPGFELDVASSEWQPGPVCTICRELCWALLVNPACGHRACESCWTHWAEAELPTCNAARHDVSKCFGLRCKAETAVALWEFAAKQSEQLAAFQGQPMVSRRRQLRQNTLYPAAVQVNCPFPDCWGLGYLGFDTVMCFICEHQWTPEEEGRRPIDMDVEETMGVKLKRCPKCKEAIEKNGGCDHMQCRCGYQFWWSTLQPYKL